MAHRDFDDDDFVTRLLCLPCADGDHHVCYGEQCRCYCGGEQAGEAAHERMVERWHDGQFHLPGMPRRPY